MGDREDLADKNNSHLVGDFSPKRGLFLRNVFSRLGGLQASRCSTFRQSGRALFFSLEKRNCGQKNADESLFAFSSRLNHFFLLVNQTERNREKSVISYKLLTFPLREAFRKEKETPRFGFTTSRGAVVDC